MKQILLVITFLFLLTPSCVNLGSYSQFESKVQARDDGGYSISLIGHTQHVQPVSAEGFFPKQTVGLQIELIGTGKEWSYRNQPGYFYTYPSSIRSDPELWDMGYAWIDINKEYIYLNFYWVNSPDSLRESRVNGKYKIE
jgi:hypothetical protein